MGRKNRPMERYGMVPPVLVWLSPISLSLLMSPLKVFGLILLLLTFIMMMMMMMMITIMMLLFLRSSNDSSSSGGGGCTDLDDSSW